MGRYLATQVREVLIEAASASEARKKAEAIFYVRPGFDKEAYRRMEVKSIAIEKVN